MEENFEQNLNGFEILILPHFDEISRKFLISFKN